MHLLQWKNAPVATLCNIVQISFSAVHSLTNKPTLIWTSWHFGKFLDSCPGKTCQACVTLTFDLWPTWTNISNSSCAHDGEPLCKFLLKSIQNCTSYGPDKNLTSKCDLDLGNTWTNITNDTSTCDREELCQIILKSIHNCSYGLDKFGQTHIHWTAVVTTMSRSPQAGSTKIYLIVFTTEKNPVYHSESIKTRNYMWLKWQNFPMKGWNAFWESKTMLVTKFPIFPTVFSKGYFQSNVKTKDY